MKKLFLIGIAATALLCSCAKDQIVDVKPQNAIGFEMFVDKSTRAAEDVTTTNLTAFELYGWRGSDQIFNKQAVSVSSGVCTYSPLQYWVGGKAYTFEAVAPKSGDNGVTFAASKDASTITFVSNSETDLIYAAGSKDLTQTATITADPGAVGMTFGHLLSRVKFTFINGADANSSAKITVSDVKITNAGTTGVYSTNGGTWAAATAEGEVSFASTSVANIVGGASAATEHKYLIPYDVQNYTLDFTVTMTQGNVSDVFTYSDVKLATSERKLLKGYSYNFVATFKPGYPIVFTASVTPWDDFTEVTIP